MQLTMTSQRKLFKAFVEVVLVSGLLLVCYSALMIFSLWVGEDVQKRLKVSLQQLFLWFWLRFFVLVAPRHFHLFGTVFLCRLRITLKDLLAEASGVS